MFGEACFLAAVHAAVNCCSHCLPYMAIAQARVLPVAAQAVLGSALPLATVCAAISVLVHFWALSLGLPHCNGLPHCACAPRSRLLVRLLTEHAVLLHTEALRTQAWYGCTYYCVLEVCFRMQLRALSLPEQRNDGTLLLCIVRFSC